MKNHLLVDFSTKCSAYSDNKTFGDRFRIM